MPRPPQRVKTVSTPAIADDHVVRSGLSRFASLWSRQKGRLVSTRLEGALERSLRCESLEGEVVNVRLRRAELEIDSGGGDRAPHAVIRMAARDWARVFTGELHVMAVILAGRAPFPKDQRRLLMQFSMLLQTTMLSGEPRDG